jgi:hypothetical protein
MMIHLWFGKTLRDCILILSGCVGEFYSRRCECISGTPVASKRHYIKYHSYAGSVHYFLAKALIS